MNTHKEAYKVTAIVPNKYWMQRGTVLTAATEEQAREKAREVLGLTDEHTLQIELVKVYPVNSHLSTDNYPYGRERATAFFSVEVVKNKGMREVFQTINPKTGRENKPKKSTYYHVILPMEKENGHFDFCGHLDFNGSEQINEGLQFMADFHELFTPDDVKDIALTAIAMVKVNVKAMVIYAGSTVESLKPLVNESINTLCRIANDGGNLWQNAKIDVKAIEATKKPDFNPFSVSKSY